MHKFFNRGIIYYKAGAVCVLSLSEVPMGSALLAGFERRLQSVAKAQEAAHMSGMKVAGKPRQTEAGLPPNVVKAGRKRVTCGYINLGGRAKVPMCPRVDECGGDCSLLRES